MKIAIITILIVAVVALLAFVIFPKWILGEEDIRDYQ